VNERRRKMKRKKTRQKYQAREFDGSDTKGANLADPRGSAFGWKSPFSLCRLSVLIRESWLSRSTQTFRELWIAKHQRRNTLREPDADALQSRQRARARARGRKGKKRSPGERETDRQREETYECGVPYNARGELPLRVASTPGCLPQGGADKTGARLRASAPRAR